VTMFISNVRLNNSRNWIRPDDKKDDKWDLINRDAKISVDHLINFFIILVIVYRHFDHKL
jgi:hypothetical protein